MLTRKRGYLAVREGPAPVPSVSLQEQGYAILEAVLDPDGIAELRADLERCYEQYPADLRNPNLTPEERDDFRYEMINRSAVAQRAVAHPAILTVIEPLLGEDCHLIANTCWRNRPRPDIEHGGAGWHIDAGPHIPHAGDVVWDDRIPYPVFAIGAHIYVQDCPSACGPTAVIPGSHKSGRFPPQDRRRDVDLTFNGVGALVLEAKAGDVTLFVSDCWHRRMPSGPGDAGRFFLQAHYGRRDIAQRLKTTSEVNQLVPEAIERASDDRARNLIGLHTPLFYDG